MHFFSPVPRMALVEIIRAEATSDTTLAQALDLARRLKKTPIVVRDARGFFTSRVFSAFTNEGLTMLSEGIAPALIENVARQTGYPVGPLAMGDELSQETMFRIRDQERIDLGAAWQRGADYDVVQRMLEAGRKGRRYGAGFYDYAPEKRLWPGLRELFPPAATQPDALEVHDRLLFAQSVEAARAWDDGVIDDPRMADVGALLGWSHPAWTGGVMSFIDQGGVAEFVARADTLADRYGLRFAPPEKLRALARDGETLYP
jgi:3-hydroxyacyl-CoA dehydrogenase/enoyl-CoA hydratase/3-hydroxybutyryl-CoA epimerase